MTAQLNSRVTFAMQPSGKEKNSLRISMKRQRSAVARNEKKDIDRRIADSVCSSQPFEHAQTVFIYCATEEEIDTYFLISQCFEAKKTVCVPRCEQTQGIMTARRIEKISDLFSGKYGIMEPSANAELISPSAIDLCIVPCLAADPAGYRLGYGGGYYDRFLSKVQCPIAALCHDARVLPVVPKEEFDIPCDYIFTERRILICETHKT